MKRYLLHDTFNLYEFETSVWGHPVHKHTYYEIIFILKGKGNHHLNGNTFNYRAGDAFFLGPEDYHYFDISSRTRFCYLRFNESYMRFANLERDSNWQKIVKTLASLSGHLTSSVIRERTQREDAMQLLKILRSEYDRRHEPYFEVLRDNIMRSIMTIIVRGLPKTSSGSNRQKNSILEDITLYIRSNIADAKALRIDALAKKFNLSPAYISIYFKKQTGESLKKYIVLHKLKLVEARLLYSQASLTSIVDEFGFTDESHLCRLFRKHYGISPGAFRSAQ